MKNKSYLFLVLGPSGVGKTTLINKILDSFADLVFIPSYTTRRSRENEIHGKDYFFVNNEEFDKMMMDSAFLEFDKPFEGRQYGIPRKEIEDSLDNGVSIIRTVAPNGLRQIIASDIQERVVSILLLPDLEYILDEVLLKRDGKLDPKRSIFSIDESLVDYKIVSKFGSPEYAFNELRTIIKQYII